MRLRLEIQWTDGLVGRLSDHESSRDTWFGNLRRRIRRRGGWVLVSPFGAFDLEVASVVVEGQIEVARRSPFDLADPDPEDVARPVRDFDPLTFFALQDQHG